MIVRSKNVTGFLDSLLTGQRKSAFSRVTFGGSVFWFRSGSPGETEPRAELSSGGDELHSLSQGSLQERTMKTPWLCCSPCVDECSVASKFLPKDGSLG